MVLPWVPVATAPPMVWSTYQENAGRVYPAGAFGVLQSQLLPSGVISLKSYIRHGWLADCQLGNEAEATPQCDAAMQMTVSGGLMQSTTTT